MSTPEAWEQYADADMLRRVTVRPIRDDERQRWDETISQRHYLGHARMVGRQIRHVAELEDEWVALLGWCDAAYHLKDREAWVGWTLEQRLGRRKFGVQNSRLLLLAERGQVPNLASRVLGLSLGRLPADWEAQYGYRPLVAETFVDPERFGGGCYRASGWEELGRTQGCRRSRRDFYEEDGHPKVLWVRALHPQARTWLSAVAMPPRYARHEDEAVYCPYTAPHFRSLWAHYVGLVDPRRAKGCRHRLASVLSLCTLATLCGARGPRAIAEFALDLNRTQLRLLGCHRKRGTTEREPPSESTIRRVLARLPAGEFDAAVVAWMEQYASGRPPQVAVDGKTVKKARRPDGRPVHLLSAVATDTVRLMAQRAVEEKSNEIPALRPLLQDVPLDGVLVTADALHTQQDAARFLVQEKGADYLLILKDNQPSILAQAERLLGGAFPP